ncbi:MYXO-CTERM sorting domain-containing protein [Nannocystis pusilla]|uniref:MYXO-CTERM sorting domain-containing protein n=1 Tax=Nannocystis pusilla TaxID=889268 RepID=UPI003B7A19D7
MRPRRGLPRGLPGHGERLGLGLRRRHLRRRRGLPDGLRRDGRHVRRRLRADGRRDLPAGLRRVRRQRVRPQRDRGELPRGLRESASDTDGQCPDGGAPGADGQCQLDDDGCGCVADGGGTRGLWGSLLLLGVFGIRRSRKRA